MSISLPDPDTSRFEALTDADVAHVDMSDSLLGIFRPDDHHHTSWNRFRRWGPHREARFDHHPAGTPRIHHDFGVWYGAWELPDTEEALACVLAEYFQESTRIDVSGATHIVIARLASPLRLLDLESGWLTRAGGNAAIVSGPRGPSRKWARAIHGTYTEIDGVAWRSSVYRPGQAVALWEPPQQRDGSRRPLLSPVCDLVAPLSDILAQVTAAAGKIRYGLDHGNPSRG